MELAFSPDLPAWLCYAVVLVVALFAAWRKVSNRLRDVSGQYSPPIWVFWQSWLLFFLYVLFPLVLFWFLDRTESIHDTSLFAALLVAVGFERIMSGQQTNLTVSENTRGLWTPFQSYVERVSTLIKKKLKQNAERWDRRVLDCVLMPDKSDPPKYPRLEKLKALAEQLTPDLAQLTAQVDGTAAQKATRGADYVMERNARIWYAEVTGCAAVDDGDTWQQLLIDEGIVNRQTYYLFSPRVRSKIMSGCVIALLIIALVSGYRSIDRQGNWNTYDLWRISKNYVSTSDIYRTRQRLTGELNNAALAPNLFTDLIKLLRDPGLKVERADVIIGLLLENRCVGGQLRVSMALQLVDSLRTQNVDVRNRINQALIFLTPADRIDSTLRSWNPSAGDSLFDLENKIDTWRQVWRNLQGVAACDTIKHKESEQPTASTPTASP